jgi:hypothetical protein
MLGAELRRRPAAESDWCRPGSSEVLFGQHLNTRLAQRLRGQALAVDEHPPMSPVVDLMATTGRRTRLQDRSLHAGGGRELDRVTGSSLVELGHVLPRYGSDAAIGAYLGGGPGGRKPPGDLRADRDEAGAAGERFYRRRRTPFSAVVAFHAEKAGRNQDGFHRRTHRVPAVWHGVKATR